MKLLWYNTEINFYQWGSPEQFAQVKTRSINPDKILVLEKFSNTPKKVLDKIAGELNKCRNQTLPTGKQRV